jgi:SOS-response transcriptional repressor LexA
MKSSWVERIRTRMQELDITSEMLANQLEITRSAVTHYLAGRRTPPLKQFHKMAQVLQTDPAWLQFGVMAEKREQQEIITKSDENHKRMPVLTCLEAAEFIYLGDDYRKKIKNWLPLFWVEYDYWFAVKIESDAMMDVSGCRKSFYEGDYIIVDPKRTPEAGNYTIALLPRMKEIIFRQYILEGGVKYLKPLNIQYPLETVDKGTVICGTVVGCVRDFGM